MYMSYTTIHYKFKQIRHVFQVNRVLGIVIVAQAEICPSLSKIDLPKFEEFADKCVGAHRGAQIHGVPFLE